MISPNKKTPTLFTYRYKNNIHQWQGLRGQIFSSFLFKFSLFMASLHNEYGTDIIYLLYNMQDCITKFLSQQK